MLELQIDSSASESLENGSWWARFNAIIFIIFMGLILLVLLFAMNSDAWDTIEARFALPEVKAIIWVVMLFVFAFVGLFIGLLLSFANKTQRGVQEQDQEQLESGISSLKIYFIIYGVVSILGIMISVFNLLTN